MNYQIILQKSKNIHVTNTLDQTTYWYYVVTDLLILCGNKDVCYINK